MLLINIVFPRLSAVPDTSLTLQVQIWAGRTWTRTRDRTTWCIEAVPRAEVDKAQYASCSKPAFSWFKLPFLWKHNWLPTLSMRPAVTSKVPPYFDQMISAFERGESGRFVHLGHWDSPPLPHTPVTEMEFAAAQQRLSDVLVEMGELIDGLSILDVGCGFGGTIENLNARNTRQQITGLNIDPRQLSICELIEPQNANQLSWCEADACNMPFPDASFDRIFCIEAMFHFDSRIQFFKEAARTLRPAGVLVASDIYVDWPELARHPHGREIATKIQEEYGPWPESSGPVIDYPEAAMENNLRVEVLYDASSHIAPSYGFVSPGPSRFDVNAIHAGGGAAYCLKYLQSINLLKYLYIKLRRPG